MKTRETVKYLLGDLPLTAELYWTLRQNGKPPRTGFKLEKLRSRLLALVDEAGEFARVAPKGKQVCIFCTLHYWISHGTVLGLALAGSGHNVTLIFTPYGDAKRAINPFDLRRQDLYARQVLNLASPLLRSLSFLKRPPAMVTLSKDLQTAIDEISVRDTQYILQMEEFDRGHPLFRLRRQRNQNAARNALWFFRDHIPDVVIIPNGSILEFGAVYQVVRWLSIPVVTYEFGEQRDRLWLAQNSEVMRQETDLLWVARGGHDLQTDQLERLRALMAARQKGDLWGNFTRRWQGTESRGGASIRSQLRLDERPVVLLATNVIGDSLTLGRQVFSDSMTEWLVRTINFFSDHREVQLVIRIHPGELITRGPSVAQVVHDIFPQGLPEHIHLISADDRTNTYDLVELADYGLVYTTTVGLEMAMSGVPAVVVGRTHYRGKGFTIDPDSWEEYFGFLNSLNKDPGSYRLTHDQVKRAWEYAYRFFFEYPLPFPWHLLHMWEDLEDWPIRRVLSDEGMDRYGRTFAYLVGEPIDWKAG